eukprot:8335945-Lingulodinium_polyedra.AAC.1
MTRSFTPIGTCGEVRLHSTSQAIQPRAALECGAHNADVQRGDADAAHESLRFFLALLGLQRCVLGTGRLQRPGLL